MAERREPDLAAKLAAAKDELDTELADIRVYFDGERERRQRLADDPYAGIAAFWGTRATGRRLLQDDELEAEARRQEDEARRRHREKLDVLQLEKGLVTPPAASETWELIDADPPLGEDFEPSPHSVPDPLEKTLFDAVLRRLDEDEPLRSIERATGLTIRQVTKIRDYHNHPNRPGPKGSPGYALYRQPLRPGTIFLRRLRLVEH